MPKKSTKRNSKRVKWQRKLKEADPDIAVQLEKIMFCRHTFNTHNLILQSVTIANLFRLFCWLFYSKY